MTALSDIIAEATETHQENGVVLRHDALQAAFVRIKDEPELAEICIKADLGRRIKMSATRTARKLGDGEPRQASLFGLRPAYALDDDAHNVKQTDDLTLREFDSLITLRQQQVTADMNQLTKLRTARRETAEIWTRHPDWVWHQVENAYSSQRRRAA